MNFSDVVNHLIEGKRLARQSWNDYYIILLPHQGFIWQVGSPNPRAIINAVIYIPSFEDIRANDWFIKIK
jgi:hypothetical protein